MSYTRKIVLVIAAAALSIGCASDRQRVEDSEFRQRDAVAARRHILRGNAALRGGDLVAAERAYRAAIAADVFSGVAHNNLGRVFYARKQLYAAAQLFDRAARLMPHQVEPRNNLGLVFEAAGRYDQAVAAYDRALRRHPDHAETLANLTRTRIRRGDGDAELRGLLERVATEDDRSEWRNWAMLMAIQLDHEDDAPRELDDAEVEAVPDEDE